MVCFNQNSLEELERLYRINLINSCSGFKSANLIATKSKAGLSNVAIFSSVIHLGSDPALLAFITRPTTVPRNTYENIKETGYYTINHVYESIIEDAHHTSAKYDSDVSEFDQTNLREEFKPEISMPFVEGAPVQMLMKFKEEHHLKVNNTIMVIGEIVQLYVEESIMSNDGFINLSKGNVVSINGLDAYTTPKLQARLAYQRPKPVEEKTAVNNI